MKAEFKFFVMAIVLIAATACAAPTPTVAPIPTSAPVASTAPVATSAPAIKTDAPAPTAAPKTEATKPVAQGQRLVIALPQWATETPFGWKSTAADRALWEGMFDNLLYIDPNTMDLKPGLATEWSHSADFKTWTFKLRQGIQFHENWGELNAEDVKYSLEQNLRPDANGLQAGPIFKANLDGIDTPDKYTVVVRFKNPMWDGALWMSNYGVQSIWSKKYLEQTGLEKAAQHPIGTGPYHLVEAHQGDYYVFEAVPNHWRQTPYFKQLVVRRVTDPATRLAGVRSGEVDIAIEDGDYVVQAKKSGVRIVERKNMLQYWVVLPGQTISGFEDYCPKCPWVSDPNDPKSQEKALKVRQALNLAVNKKAIIDNLWQGYGSETMGSYWLYPGMKGYTADWKLPPYDPQKAKQLLTEAGYPNGFEINVVMVAQSPDSPDIMEAVALDWTKVGITPKRSTMDTPTFYTKVPVRKLGQQAWVFGVPGRQDPALTYKSGLSTKGTGFLLAEYPELEKQGIATGAETDETKRVQMTTELAQKLYDGYYGVMIGIKSATWVVSPKVGNWPVVGTSTWQYGPEYITPAGQ